MESPARLSRRSHDLLGRIKPPRGCRVRHPRPVALFADACGGRASGRNGACAV